MMDVKSLTADMLFRVYTQCPEDPVTLVLDVRPQKEFFKKHILQAYCVRLSANGKVLLDYSKNTYTFKWSQDCWWGKNVVVYGDEKLRKDHPVVAYLAKENKCKKLAIFKEGINAFEAQYPFLITASTKANAGKRYPGEIIPGLLYLGDWELAKAFDRLDEINVKRIITIHNNPDDLKAPTRFQHLKYTLADVDTENITPFFSPSFDFIEDAREAKQAVLIHCGAGVSRSAALCIAYLMRKLSWTAEKARAHCKLRRSVVNPNDGFWRSLCGFEGVLGLSARSNPAATGGFHGSDAPVQIDEGAAGDKVTVTFKSVAELNADEERRKASALATTSKHAGENGSTLDNGKTRRDDDRGRQRDRDQNRGHDRGGGQRLGSPRGRSRSRDRSVDRGRGRDEARVRSRDRGRTRDQGRDRSPGRGRARQDSRSRSRSRGRAVDQARDRGRERGRGGDETRDWGRGDGARGDARGGSRERGGKRSRSKEERSGKVTPTVQDSVDDGREGLAKNGAVLNGSAATAPGGATPVILDVLRDGKTLLGQLKVEGLTRRNACIFGRHPQCDVHLEHASISRNHAKLMLDSAGSLIITDMGSAHNTWVDGAWIRPDVPRSLSKGSQFRLGASSRQYKIAQVPPTAAAAKRAAQAVIEAEPPSKRVKSE